MTVVPRFVLRERARPERVAAATPVRPRRAAAPPPAVGNAPLVAEPLPLPSNSPQGLSEGLRKALRRSPIGCANVQALDQAETDACIEAFGKDARSAAFIAPPMARDKRNGFDEKVAAREQMRIYRETGVYSGMRDALKAAR